ncbi:hypothetical protein BDZ45DRAFT_684118 [Acephala macrosclerotiorum]|nr:hypothetical protein BDZ45DRAFT_684118 [Acephala macrosclerotiorum]
MVQYTCQYRYTEIEAPKTSPNKPIPIDKFNKLANEDPNSLVGKHIFQYFPDTNTYEYQRKYHASNHTAPARLQDLLADYAAHAIELSLTAIKKYASLPKGEFFKQQTEKYLHELCGQPWKDAIRGGENFAKTLREKRGQDEYMNIDTDSWFATIIDYLSVRNKIDPSAYHRGYTMRFNFGDDVREMFDLLKHDTSMKYSLRRRWREVFITHINRWSDLTLEHILDMPMEGFEGGEWTDQNIAYGQLWRDEFRDILVYKSNKDEETLVEENPTSASDDSDSNDSDSDEIDTDKYSDIDSDDIEFDDTDSNNIDSDELTTIVAEEPQEGEAVENHTEQNETTQDTSLLNPKLRSWANRVLRFALSEYSRYGVQQPSQVKAYMRWCEDILAISHNELTIYLKAQFSPVMKETVGTSNWIQLGLDLECYAVDQMDFLPLLDEDHEMALRKAYHGLPERICPWNGDAGHRYLPSLAQMPHQQPGETLRRRLRWERFFYDEMMGIEQDAIDDTLQENRRPTPPASVERSQEPWPIRVLLQGDEQRRRERLVRERRELNSAGSVLGERMNRL